MYNQMSCSTCGRNNHLTAYCRRKHTKLTKLVRTKKGYSSKMHSGDRLAEIQTKKRPPPQKETINWTYGTNKPIRYVQQDSKD